MFFKVSVQPLAAICFVLKSDKTLLEFGIMTSLCHPPTARKPRSVIRKLKPLPGKSCVGLESLGSHSALPVSPTLSDYMAAAFKVLIELRASLALPSQAPFFSLSGEMPERCSESRAPFPARAI